MLASLLEQFGFSEKESKVYLSCLELGHAPVSSIARNIGENRVTTYSILKNLAAKGIAQTTIKNKSTYYSVIAPDKFLQDLRINVCRLGGSENDDLGKSFPKEIGYYFKSFR